MMNAADDLAWCGFLRQLILAWDKQDTMNNVAERLGVKKARVYKAIRWLRREGVAAKSGEQLLTFCRRDIYSMDVDRALLAVKRRELAARKEVLTTPSWPGPIEKGLVAMARRRVAVSRKVSNRRTKSVASTHPKNANT
ncbi:hypothetical protein ACUHMQ_06735 [Chitinimonas sp. PSY-7]|uniref:hypothetical protein n=1 Tax=Chitinimonas sp. PSY-7 TaxID=3459088 RepID=UPI00403FF837